jgi:hypothetical protein
MEKTGKANITEMTYDAINYSIEAENIVLLFT